MDFTVSILDYQLNRLYRTEHRGSWNHRMILKQILLWDNTGGRENALYLFPQFLQNVMRRPSAHDLVLYILEESSAGKCREQDGYFLICPDGCLLDAFNRVLRLYDEFRTWLWELQELSTSSRNLQKLLDCSSAYLDISLIIVDYEFQFVAFSDRESCSFRQIFFPEKGRMDLDEIQQLYMNDRNFDETYTREGLTPYPIASEEFRNYYVNIYYRRQYLARLLLLLPTSADCPGSHLLMEHLGEVLTSCYQYYYETKMSEIRSSGIYELFRALLNGDEVSREQADRTLQTAGWRPAHTYQILKFQPERHSSSGFSLDYFCIQVENTFSECLAVQAEHSIFCVRNLSLAEDADTFRTELPYFLREGLCRAGISNTFADFFQCALYAAEASEALVLGSQAAPTFWYYNFSDFTLEYILKKATESYPARELCHPAVRTLYDYDAVHPGSALTETLYQYLQQGLSASRAAEALHVHRTTFLYRMRKIRQLCPFREEDMQEILRMGLSFCLCPELGAGE